MSRSATNRSATSRSSGKPLFPDVIVNGELVEHRAIASEAQNHRASRGKPGIAWRKAANALAIRTLLLQEAKRRGIQAEPIESSPGRFEAREEALIRALLDEAVDAPSPTQEQVKAEWERNPSRFRSPPLWEASHILLACGEEKQGDEKARKKAESLIRLLRKDSSSFASLASRESDCSSSSSGGFLGQIRPGDSEPQFEAALRSMREGEISSSPARTRHGWHVIRLDGFAEGRPLPFEAVKETIAEALEKLAWSRAAHGFTRELIASASISGADPGVPVVEPDGQVQNGPVRGGPVRD